MRRIGERERRARLAVRHRLAPPRAATPAEAAAAVVALHATDPASVFLSVAARTAPVRPAAIEAALYEQRSLIRLVAMRRTMFVAPIDLAPALHALGRDMAAAQRRRYASLLAAGGAGDEAWLRETEDAAARALQALGRATGAQLSAAEPRLRTQVMLNEGKKYGGPQSVTTWVLVLLGLDGRIVRGRPNGSWISSRYVWAPMSAWLPGGLAEVPAAAARAEVVRRWLAAFGPGTVADIRWWTGWTAAQVRVALAAVDAVEVDLDGQPGLVLPGDLDEVAEPEPDVALLPALDPTPMGWQGRAWYLGGHAPVLFDRNGNIGPTVWWGGRVVGGWAQRSSGEVVFRLLEDVGADVTARVAAAAARLAEWIGPVRVTPRFRTPLERELTA